MGMQVPSGLDSEMRGRKFIWPTSEDLASILRKLAFQKESEVVEGKLRADHVHMVVSIPPKYSVSQSGWVYEGQECDLGCKGNGEEPEFCGSEFLGSRLLCFNDWPG